MRIVNILSWSGQELNRNNDVSLSKWKDEVKIILSWNDKSELNNNKYIMTVSVNDEINSIQQTKGNVIS